MLVEGFHSEKKKDELWQYAVDFLFLFHLCINGSVLSVSSTTNIGQYFDSSDLCIFPPFAFS